MAWTPILSDDFTGTDGAAWDTSKWADESNGTAATSIDANRGEFEYADVGADNARVIVLDGSGSDLVVSDCRCEFLYTLPSALTLTASTAGLIGVSLRTDGLWRNGTTHDPNNGYAFFISVDDTGGAIEAGMFMEVDGAFTALGTDYQIDDGTGGITQLRVRFEVMGDQLRMIARDASLGALPDGVWDNQDTDATFASGQAQMAVRGPTGGSSPDRFAWIDDITLSEFVAVADMALIATPVAADRINLSWSNPPNTASVEVYRRGPADTQVFDDTWTGTDNNPWDAAKWVDESLGTGLVQIVGNRGEMQVADVGTDEVRVRALSGGLPLVARNALLEYTLELPHGLSASSGVGYGFGFNLRTDHEWSTVPHDPRNGYRFTVYRNDTSDEIQLSFFVCVNNVATELGATFVVPGSSSIDSVNVRMEALGDRLRSLVRDVNTGPLPAYGTWDHEVADATFAEGGIGIGVRGPTGGSSPQRIGFIDNLVIDSSNFVLLDTLGAVESYQDGPASGLVPGTPYDYRVLAFDAVPAQIGLGEDSATTLTAPGRGPLIPGHRNSLLASRLVIS